MVERPLLTPIVVAFWCLTSGWLLVEKILPTLAPGSPPGQQAFYTAGNRLIPVAWTVQWNDHPLGWAISETQRTPENGLIVDSRMHFDRLPLDEIMPSWTTLLMQRALPKNANLALDTRGRISIDSEGNLRTFMSIVNLPGSKDHMLLAGTVEDGTVKVNVHAGEFHYETSCHLPTQMVGDELSPQAMMPGLHEGQRWTLPVYSPLRAGSSPLQILHAEVGPEETLYWDGRLVRVHVVSYREDPSSHKEPRCRLWVDRSGRVLKQEAAMLGSRLSFLRRTDADAAQLAARLVDGEQEPDAPGQPEGKAAP
jgi:hypothetical protein